MIGKRRIICSKRGGILSESKSGLALVIPVVPDRVLVAVIMMVIVLMFLFYCKDQMIPEMKVDPNGTSPLEYSISFSVPPMQQNSHIR